MDPLSHLENRLNSLPVDDFEVYVTENRLFSAQAKEGEVEFTEEAVERGAAIRLFKGGRAGFSCSSDWTVSFLDRMVDLSYNSLSVLEETVRFELPGREEWKEWRPRSSLPPEKKTKLEAALALEREARAFDRRIVRVRDAQYSEEVKSVRIKNSRGLFRENKKTLCELSIMLVAEERGNREMAWEEEFSPDFVNLDPKKVASRAAEKAVSQLGAEPIPTQKSAALLDPVVGASFLGVLASSFFGDQVQKNRSALRERLGETIYSKGVTLVDDGRYPDGYSSFPFDGEGSGTKETGLVVDGVLQEFLYDARSGAQAGRRSTGNALRPHFKESPRVGATNLYVKGGSGSLSRLVSEMGTGFWIRDVIGVHTADSVTGDFSLGASGVWLEGGERKKAVRGVTISGNLHELFKRVVRAGEEVRFYRSYGAPPLLIDSVDIGGL